MSIIHNRSRAGSALVVSSIVIITIAGMAIALTDLTIGRYTEQKYRQAQVDLLAATESAANETVNWMKNNTSVQDALKNMAVSSPGYPKAESSNSATLVSSSLPPSLPAVFPSLMPKGSGTSTYTQGGTYTTSSSTGTSGANSAGRRNACSVTTKVIKVASSANPSVWDGSERFIVYTTAESGDRTRPDSVRRQRVETVITAVSTTVSSTTTTTTTTSVPTPAYPFTRGMFSLNGYDFKGAATTDSWKSDSNGDGIADTPYNKPASYTIGGPNSHGDVGSNGVLGSGAYDTSKVHGQATPNANASLPNVTYAPPTSGYTSVAAITANKTLTGVGGGTTVFRTPSVVHKNKNTLTIGGSGTVVLYVDGAFNVGDVVFAAGSTAKLVIYQNDIGGKGASFNAQNTIGDVKNPSRFLFVTAFSGTGSNEMSLNGGANFSAVVLAPNAGMKFNGGSNFFGSFVGKDFSGAVNGNFSFHYDESLAGLSWGSVMKDITTTSTTTTTTPTLSMLAPTAWNVRSVGYNAP
ncbi:MAG: hypothetical protein H0W78_06870 [Planctomycetes bacterium]|nr:hypothetical protein [Planctomycetota bacterium]